MLPQYLVRKWKIKKNPKRAGERCIRIEKHKSFSKSVFYVNSHEINDDHHIIIMLLQCSIGIFVIKSITTKLIICANR